jgi:RNA polymerase sigma factor (sigma-70 family)
MQSANDKKFYEATNNDYYRKILIKVCNQNLKNVCSKDEINSLMMNTLWNCLQKYNKTKNTKFSSYLYRSIQNNTRRIYKSKAREFNNVSIIDNFHSILTTSDADKKEARDILDSVKDINSELYEVLIQKYFYGMTNKEIGEKNGYTKEAARKKLKKALDLCRKIVYS